MLLADCGDDTRLAQTFLMMGRAYHRRGGMSSRGRGGLRSPPTLTECRQQLRRWVMRSVAPVPPLRTFPWTAGRRGAIIAATTRVP